MNIKKSLSNLFSKKSLTGSGVKAIFANAGMTADESDRFKRWVYACITKTAQGIAQTDWQLAQVTKKDVTKIEDHELLSLLYKFNPKTTKYNSLYLTILYFLKDGEVAWILEKPNGRVKPTALYVAPTSTLQVTKKDEEGNPTSYRFTVGNKVQEIPADIVKIFINPNPNDPSRGMSVISAMADVVDNDTRMVKFNKALLGKSAVPSGSIELKGSLDAGQTKLLKDQFDSLYSGYNNAGATIVLPNGAKFNPFGIPPKDMEYIEGRKMNREEILAIFGVPPIILGLGGDYNRATSETAERMFAKYTLQPLMTMIVEQINISLTPIYGTNLLVTFSDLDIVDSEQKLNEQTAGYNKWLTTNEIREENGLVPVQGGDMIYVPLNLVPSIGGEVTKSQTKMLRVVKNGNSDFGVKKSNDIRLKVQARDYILNSRNADMSDRIFKKLVNRKKPFSMKIIKEKPQLKIDSKKKREIWKVAEKTRKQIEKLFVKKLQGLFETQKQLVLDNLDLQKKGLDADPFVLEKEINSTIAIIEPSYYEALTLGAKLASEISDVDYVDITNIPSVREWAKTLSNKYATEITELTYKKTVDTVQNAVTEGLGTDELAKNITELFDGMSETRSLTIARTESARALTAGQANEWEQVGVEKFEWLTSGDGNVSEICLYNETQDWSVKEAKEGTVGYSHPNCRCVFLPK